MAVDASREFPAVVHSADDRVIGWSPDGRHLLFTSDRTGANAIWAVRYGNGRTDGAPELLKSDIGADSYPLGLTKSGTLMLYKNISSRDIKVAPIDLDAGKVGQTIHFARGYLPAPQDPHWSPDGKFLVYQSRGNSDRLAIRSVETGDVRRASGSLRYGRDPRWSPDGKSLILGGRDSKGRDGVFLIDIDKNSVTTVFNTPRFDADPRWGRDASKFYYKDVTQPDRIVERDLTSGKEREVVRGAPVRNFEVSPDGQSLAIQTQLDTASQSVALLLVTIADGATRNLVRIGASEWLHQQHTMAWTPDSRHLLFVKRAAATAALWAVDVATGQLRRFDTSGADAAEALLVQDYNFLDGGFSLSPDGRQIAFLMGKSAAEVWALENFLPPQRPVQTARK